MLHIAEALHVMPATEPNCFQPDVEAGQRSELNMSWRFCVLSWGGRKAPVCVCRQESFLALLHWKSTGAWLCGLMLHWRLRGVAVRAVQGNHLEIYPNSFEAIKTFWEKLPCGFWSFAISQLHTGGFKKNDVAELKLFIALCWSRVGRWLVDGSFVNLHKGHAWEAKVFSVLNGD